MTTWAHYIGREKWTEDHWIWLVVCALFCFCDARICPRRQASHVVWVSCFELDRFIPCNAWGRTHAGNLHECDSRGRNQQQNKRKPDLWMRSWNTRYWGGKANNQTPNTKYEIRNTIHDTNSLLIHCHAPRNETTIHIRNSESWKWLVGKYLGMG